MEYMMLAGDRGENVARLVSRQTVWHLGEDNV